MKYSIEYGEYTVDYEIEGDCDGNIAIIKSVTSECGTVDIIMFDPDTIADMEFHCRSDFAYRQHKHYIETGEIL